MLLAEVRLKILALFTNQIYEVSPGTEDHREGWREKGALLHRLGRYPDQRLFEDSINFAFYPLILRKRLTWRYNFQVAPATVPGSFLPHHAAHSSPSKKWIGIALI